MELRCLHNMVQRGHSFAIVDEVDSILIDEARTPLIISGPTDDQSETYRQVDAVMGALVKADYELDEKSRQVSLTEAGNEHMAEMLKAAGLLEHVAPAIAEIVRSRGRGNFHKLQLG